MAKESGTKVGGVARSSRTIIPMGVRKVRRRAGESFSEISRPKPITQRQALLKGNRPVYSYPTDAMGRKINPDDKVLYRGGFGEIIQAQVLHVDLDPMTVTVRPYRIAGIDFTGFAATLRRWDKALVIHRQ